jgi:hypothetical protein
MEIVFVAQVPGDVRERGQPRDAVAVVQVFLRTARRKRRGQNLAADIEDDRHDHVLLPCVAEQAFVLLPMIDIESRQVETRVGHIVRPLGRPGIQVQLESVRRHHGLIPRMRLVAAVQQHPQPVNFVCRQPFDAAADRLVVPTHQVIRRRAIPEIVFTAALPDEVLGVL